MTVSLRAVYAVAITVGALAGMGQPSPLMAFGAFMAAFLASLVGAAFCATVAGVSWGW